MGTPSVGGSEGAAYSADSTVDATDMPFEFVSESLSKQGTIMDTNGIRGTRSHLAERTRTGVRVSSGTLVIHPSPKVLDKFLPHILGGSEITTSDEFPLAETLSSFSLMISRGAKDFRYDGCWINRATFRGSQGQFMELALDIEAESETVLAAGTLDAITFSDTSTLTEKPYTFMDGVFTLVASARDVFDFEVVIDNFLNTDRHLNTLDRAMLPAMDRGVTVRLTTPYSSDETDLYAQALAGSAATFAFTNSDDTDQVLTMTFATIQFPDRSPVIPGKAVEIPLQLEGVARESGGTKELVITNADT